MTTAHTSTDQIADLILRGEEEGGLLLSEIERLGDGLPQEPLEALYERVVTHGVEVWDDCGDMGPRPASAGGVLEAATTTALWLYVGEVIPPPLLTAGEELVLAIEIERGDRRSKQRMINANLRLVVSVAKRYEGRGLPLLDLIRAGIVGLVRAVDTFDWRRGHSFPSYATWRVLEALHRLEQDSHGEAVPIAERREALSKLVA